MQPLGRRPSYRVADPYPLVELLLGFGLSPGRVAEVLTLEPVAVLILRDDMRRHAIGLDDEWARHAPALLDDARRHEPSLVDEARRLARIAADKGVGP